MRVRSVVIPVALAVAAAVAVPTSASAAPGCGLRGPLKVVVDQPREVKAIDLTAACYDTDVDFANWRYHHSSGAEFPVDFTRAHLDLEAPRDYSVFFDDTHIGVWRLSPTGAETSGGAPVSQNSAVTRVKYGAELNAAVTRTSKELTWAVAATQWSGRLHKEVVRPGVTVGLFHQKDPLSPWRFVKSVTTSSTGKATVSVSSPKAGSYRLKIAETDTTWAAYSRTVKGRV